MTAIGVSRGDLSDTWHSDGDTDHPSGASAYDHVVAYDEDLADRIRDLLGDEADVSEQRMFGGLAFLVGGNMAVAASGQGGVLVRVDPSQSERLTAQGTARPMVMRGRAMKGWVRVDEASVRTKRQLGTWVTIGVDYATDAAGQARWQAVVTFDWAGIVETEGAAAGDAAAVDLTASVPAAPEWDTTELLRHLGLVHFRTSVILRTGTLERPSRKNGMLPEPPADGVLDWYRATLAAVVADLRGLDDPERPVYSFAPHQQRAGFWPRRMAHETTVHRVDAEQAAGRPAGADRT